MKRRLRVASALVGCLAAAAAFAGGPEIIQEPDYFSGFFVGGTGAFHMAGFGGSSSAVVADDLVGNFVAISPEGIPFPFSQTFFSAGTLASNGIDGNSYDGFYGVQGGVGKVFNHRWYAGFVGFGEWGTQSNTDVNTANFNKTNTLPLLGIGITNSGSTTSSTTVKLSNDYGVAFKPGFLVAPRTMVYGKIGAVWAQLKVSNTVSSTSETKIVDTALPGSPTIYDAKGQLGGSSSNEDNKIALLLGIGLEQFIYRDFVTLNVEYDYANYGSVTTTTPLTGTGTVVAGGGVFPPFGGSTSFSGPTAQATANAKVGTLLAGLNFYFGSQWF